MSIRMECRNCGRSFYSASAPVIVADGDRCSWCGGPLDIVWPGSDSAAARAAMGPASTRRADGIDKNSTSE